MADDLVMNGTLYVCATPQHNDDLTQSEFEALTWVEVGKIVTMPQIGYETNVVTQGYINTDFSVDAKGFLNGSSGEVLVGRDPEDAGQEIMREAAGSRFRYAFKREYADAVSGFTATITYFRALVTSLMDAGGSAEDFDNETYSIKVTAQRPIIVPPKAV